MSDSAPPPLPTSYPGYSSGPPAGLPTSPDDRYAAGRIDSRARNALILGVCGILPLGILTGVPAIFVGVHALRRINSSDGTLKGRLAAWCAIVLGCISVIELAAIVYAALN
jgi:hypothetical protein